MDKSSERIEREPRSTGFCRQPRRTIKVGMIVQKFRHPIFPVIDLGFRYSHDKLVIGDDIFQRQMGLIRDQNRDASPRQRFKEPQAAEAVTARTDDEPALIQMVAILRRQPSELVGRVRHVKISAGVAAMNSVRSSSIQRLEDSPTHTATRDRRSLKSDVDRTLVDR